MNRHLPSPGPQSSEPAQRPALRGMNLPAMKEMLGQAGFKPYRARQLYEWVFVHGADDFQQMTNLPAELRQWLAETTRLGGSQIVRVVGDPRQTCKVVLRLHDGALIESVIMREQCDEPPSVCLSSQVGCALGCAFCRTGYGGFQRNLTVDEITGQLLALRQVLGPDVRIRHVVLMGMGEPMLNLEALVPALELIIDPHGLKISRRRLTVSTAGHVPGMKEFARRAPRVGLAVSLNATTDQIRSQIMPINRMWGLGDLLHACRTFPLEPRQRITFEYVLLRDLNDTLNDARRLAGMIKDIRSKVNLIMYNPTPEFPWLPASDRQVEQFAGVLSQAHYTVTIRRSKGQEIGAACGQLAAHHFGLDAHE